MALAWGQVPQVRVGLMELGGSLWHRRWGAPCSLALASLGGPCLPLAAKGEARAPRPGLHSLVEQRP